MKKHKSKKIRDFTAGKVLQLFEKQQTFVYNLFKTLLSYYVSLDLKVNKTKNEKLNKKADALIEKAAIEHVHFKKRVDELMVDDKLKVLNHLLISALQTYEMSRTLINYDEKEISVKEKYEKLGNVIKTWYTSQLDELNKIILLNDDVLGIRKKTQINLVGEMKSMQIMITDYCACQCKMCTHWKCKDKKVLSLEKIKEIVDDAKKMECKSIVLSGGEPFFHKDIIEIMDYIMSKEIYLGILTTGFFPNADAIFNYIKNKDKKYFGWIRVSIDTIKDYKKLRGIELGPQNLFLHFIKEQGISTRINIVNLKKIDHSDIVEYAEKHNYEYKIWEEIIHDKKAKIPKFRCIAPLFHCAITADGNIFPCCYLSMDTTDQINKEAIIGNINEQKLFDIWQEFKGVKERLYKGELFPICSKCTRYAEINSGNFEKLFY